MFNKLSSTSSASTSSATEIPGFFYDPLTKRYYALQNAPKKFLHKINRIKQHKKRKFELERLTDKSKQQLQRGSSSLINNNNILHILAKRQIVGDYDNISNTSCKIFSNRININNDDGKKCYYIDKLYQVRNYLNKCSSYMFICQNVSKSIIKSNLYSNNNYNNNGSNNLQVLFNLNVNKNTDIHSISLQANTIKFDYQNNHHHQHVVPKLSLPLVKDKFHQYKCSLSLSTNKNYDPVYHFSSSTHVNYVNQSNTEMMVCYS